MTYAIVTSIQFESLQNSRSVANVMATPFEVLGVAANQNVRVHCVRFESMGVQANQPARVHASQLEAVGVQADQPARVHSITAEVIFQNPTAAAVTHMSIEVLRVIPGRRRRSPLTVVAN